MIQVEIELLTNNCVKPYQKYKNLEFITFNKLFATHSTAEHGLAFLINIFEIEDENKKLLKKMIFDTGGPNKTFLHNLDVRGYQLYDLDTIALSHWHYDHTGGLYDILKRVKKEVSVITHQAAKFERFFNRSQDIDMKMMKGESRDSIIKYLSQSKIVNQKPINQPLINELNGKLIFSKDDYVIFDNGVVKMVLSGEIARNHFDEDFSHYMSIQNDNILQEDKILDDKCLIIKIGNEVILLNGCCHSGLKNTIDYVIKKNSGKISHIIGGLHMAGSPIDKIESAIKYLKNYVKKDSILYVFPTHCTGDNFIRKLSNIDKANLKTFEISIGTKFIFEE